MPEARGEYVSVMDEPDEATVEAVGRVTEALETTERARGHLHSFHQLTGTADFQLGDAVDRLREAGQCDLADEIEREMVGRNVLDGRWTYQVLEEYDDGYYAAFRATEQRVRDLLTGGERHVYEARMKQVRRTHDHPHHTRAPGQPDEPEQAE